MSLVRLEVAGGIAHLTLCRAGMHNALVPELLEALLGALGEVRDDPRARAVVLAAEGPAFSIGGDMRRFQRERGDLQAYSSRLVGLLNEAILALVDLPQPVVAAVHGLVTGGSLGLVLAADFVYLTPRVALKAHYTTAAFGPDGGWTALAPRLAGLRRAASALMLNRTIRADDAVEWGLATEVVPADALLDTATATAQRLASFPAGTLRAAKDLLWGDRAALAAALEGERRHFLDLVARPEAIEGVDAFLRDFHDYPHDQE
ncbi:enoyl-CoA hydratase/isomerase family protein [Mesoterricola silvestris]|uniref:Enoyl-CoA hydratase n=1 Tax=Mesoterricola silvestris TaxID=2927979 RepID=A0AA48GLW1_9BACT|nr:enoyl-CoA hydratase/isomerase family protein [Mesoterricola silvestris]BDU73689.1 enoyl-CoA hydratase [Mesoterricola silvestris]